MFYVYVDWTIEEVPRPFYVGKGNKNRIKQIIRNRYHTNISNKHGMKREIVLSTLDESSALELEKRLIKDYHTFINDESGWGANLTLGGEGTSGYKHNEQFRTMMSNRWRGKKKSEESRRKNSESHKGKTFSKRGKVPAISAALKGRKFSDEHRKNLSLTHKGKPPPNRKRVIQTTLNDIFIAEFQSVKEASETTKVHYSNITRCCAGNGKSAGGFKWTFSS